MAPLLNDWHLKDLAEENIEQLTPKELEQVLLATMQEEKLAVDEKIERLEKDPHPIDLLDLHSSRTVLHELAPKLAVLEAKIVEDTNNTENRQKQDESNRQWGIASRAEPLISKPFSLAATIVKPDVPTNLSFVEAMKLSAEAGFYATAKTILSPLDYLWKTWVAGRDLLAAWRDKRAAQRKTKMGAAAFTITSALAYIGLGIAMALTAAAVTAVTVVVAPLLLVGMSAANAYKEGYILHQSRKRTKELEKDLIGHDKVQTTGFSSKLDYLKAKRHYCELQQKKNVLKSHQTTKSVQKRKVVTSILTLLGYGLVALSPLFPPLALVGAGCVVAAALIEGASAARDVYRKTQQQNAKPLANNKNDRSEPESTAQIFTDFSHGDRNTAMEMADGCAQEIMSGTDLEQNASKNIVAPSSSNKSQVNSVAAKQIIETAEDQEGEGGKPLSPHLY